METKMPGKKESLFQVQLKDFLEGVSIGGVKYIANNTASVIRRLLWLMLVLFGAGFATYQISTQIRYFLGYHTLVTTTINVNETLAFPTVTICRNGIFNKTALLEIDPSGNLTWVYSILYPPVLAPLSDDDMNRALGILADHNHLDWNHVYDHIMSSTAKLTHYCAFNGVPCPSSFITEITQLTGKCLQLNPDGISLTSQPGTWNGLILLMTAGQETAFVLPSGSTGFKVELHDFTELAEPDVIGFNIDVNRESLIKISSKEIIQLSDPYGTCRDQVEYHHTRCTIECRERYTYKQCGCRWTHQQTFDYPANTSVCTGIDSMTCMFPAMARYVSDDILKTVCDCPVQCKEKVYPFSMTSAQLSDNFIEWVETTQPSWLNFTEEYMRNNLAYVNIYYENLMHEKQETVPAYTTVSLLCDVGGALGLILGSTILTAFEFGDFLIVSLYHLRCNNKVKIES